MFVDLLVNNIIIFITLIISFFNIPSLYKSLVKDLPSSINININYYYIIFVISLLITIFIIYIIIRKKELQSRNLLIVLSIVLGILGSDFSFIIFILSIINIINFSKMPKPINEIHQMPIIKYKTNNKIIIKSIILLVIYSIYIWLPDFITIPKTFAIYYYIIIDIILLISTILLFYKELYNSFIMFFKNVKIYLSFIIKKYFKTLLIYIPLSLLCFYIVGNQSVNQQAIEKMPYLYILFSALIFAPLVEETVFRLAIHKLIKNKYVFIITSALIFGLLHAINEDNIFNILLTMLPYGTIGGYLAYLYDKTGNVAVDITAHFLINLMGCIALLWGI